MPKVRFKVGATYQIFDLSALKEGGKGQYNGNAVPIRCPHCGNNGSFMPHLGGSLDYSLKDTQGKGPFNVPVWYGIRHCPNPSCKAPVFIAEQLGELAFSFPHQSIDFDASSVPERVAGSLREAIECHAANCYRGAALLSRRTLEEICDDRAAKGSDLRKRIISLGSLITVPKALIDAMDEIRLLGNDAAHVEAKTYDDISSEEVEIAIALCKELIKAVYQYDDLLSKIRSLKKLCNSLSISYNSSVIIAPLYLEIPGAGKFPKFRRIPGTGKNSGRKNSGDSILNS
ncbi:MAG: DUF4145 domain-containing protein [Novosphingobium sp.]|nr:DUF4145 domain-containing protein [Novosphingobium sp.]